MKPFRPLETQRTASGSVTRDWSPEPSPRPDVAPKGMSVARAKASPPKAVPVCSYCGTPGGKGTAIVCGRPCPCPSCSVPGWAALVETYGARSA